MPKLKLFFLLFFANISLFVKSQTPVFISDSLDIYIEREMRNWEIPGVAICIVKDGKVAVMKGYGNKEKGKPDEVDENTLFMIASNTKAMTGTALAMLETEGKCSLNDRVINYLPEFKMKDPWVTTQLTLTDVLTHRLGMETFQGDFMYFDSDLNKNQMIEKMGKLTPLYDFRTKWGYCNAGYLIAGECIEKISGMSWEEFMKKRLFEPLGMKSTLVNSKNIHSAVNKASAHTIVNGKIEKIPYGEMDALSPAGSVVSNVSDMSRWLIAQLDSGRIDGKEVIPFKAIKRTRKPESIVGKGRHPFNTSHYRLYGLGWTLQDYEGKEIVSHTGGIHGFVTSVTLIPEENLGIIVLTNTDNNLLFEALKLEIVDAYLNLPYRNYSSFFFDYNNKNKQKDQQEMASLRDSVKLYLASNKKFNPDLFTGKYNHEVYGSLNITKSGKNLLMKFEHHPHLSAKMEPVSESKFLCTFNNPIYGVRMMPFQIIDGKVKKLTLTVSDFIEFTAYEFFKE